jgi:NTE family protein
MDGSISLGVNSKHTIKNKIETLLFSGGGIRGICYIGCLKYLEIQQDITLDISEICGVSIGSIISFFYVLGYTADEIKSAVFDKNLEKLKNISFINFIYQYGLDNGDTIMKWLESFILLKFNKDAQLTFKELYDLVPIKLNILSTNLNKYTYTQFNHSTTPSVKVLDAIRMSISIPLLFTKQIYNNDIHVDGCLIGSYPIKLYNDKLDTLLGFKLISLGEQDEDVSIKIDSLETFIYNIYSCYTSQKEKYTVISEKYQKHTIYIHSENITQNIKFKLSIQEKQELFDLGYNTTKNTLVQHLATF